MNDDSDGIDPGRTATPGDTILEIPSSSGSIVPGRTIFRKFRVIRKLGRGGMGEVWLVRHQWLQCLRALKVIDSGLLAHPAPLERFKREARAMVVFSGPQNPHAVAVHDAQFAVDGTYIEMEYVRGRTIAELLQPGEPMPLPWIARVVGQLCDVLDVAHAHMIVHRDLKPSNLMLVDGHPPGQEHLKVLDLGLVKILGADSRTALITHGFLGTPAYASPEQVWGQGDLDGRSDLFSIGVILYEFLTGHRPFRSILHIGTGPPPPLAEMNPRIQAPPALEQLVFRCLAIDPNDRPRSAAALAEQLSRALAS
jgi:serine/threonine protein kinase